MNARIFATATLAITFTAILPAKAADGQLLSLVMPDAKVLAGINVEQAKGTQFGQYVLSLMQMRELQDFATQTGFDPTRDVREVLLASAATPGMQTHATQSGLALARGTFDPAKIQSLVVAKGGIAEQYNGMTILEDPKGQMGVAFLDATLVMAGDIATVKAAIDRTKAPVAIPSDLAAKVHDWSLSQDAWVISTIPTSNLIPPAGAPQLPGIGNNALQGIKGAAAGVKLGATVVMKAEVTADTAPNAQAMGDALKMLANLALLQQNIDANAKTLLQSLNVAASGTILTVSVSMPQDQLRQVVQPRGVAPARVRRQAR